MGPPRAPGPFNLYRPESGPGCCSKEFNSAKNIIDTVLATKWFKTGKQWKFAALSRISWSVDTLVGPRIHLIPTSFGSRLGSSTKRSKGRPDDVSRGTCRCRRVDSLRSLVGCYIGERSFFRSGKIFSLFSPPSFYFSLAAMRYNAWPSKKRKAGKNKIREFSSRNFSKLFLNSSTHFTALNKKKNPFSGTIFGGACVGTSSTCR